LACSLYYNRGTPNQHARFLEEIGTSCRRTIADTTGVLCSTIPSLDRDDIVLTAEHVLSHPNVLHNDAESRGAGQRAICSE
jgi:hypothetical protein